MADSSDAKWTSVEMMNDGTAYDDGLSSHKYLPSLVQPTKSFRDAGGPANLEPQLDLNGKAMGPWTDSRR